MFFHKSNGKLIFDAIPNKRVENVKQTFSFYYNILLNVIYLQTKAKLCKKFTKTILFACISLRHRYYYYRSPTSKASREVANEIIPQGGMKFFTPQISPLLNYYYLITASFYLQL